MIISHKHKFIFIAIPKTGTTTIHNVFSNLDDETLFIERKNKNTKGRVNQFIYKHITATDLEKQIENFDEYFKFTFVRNPYDRLVSWVYYYINRLPQNKKININEHSFKELISKCPDHIWDSQFPFVSSKDNKNLMNFVGKFEKFQEDYNLICDKIGIPQQHLPHINKSRHKHYTEYYNDEILEIVEKKYAKDIEYFGYKFGE